MSTTERIRIQVTQDGAKAVRRDIEGLGTGANAAAGQMAGLAATIKGLVLGAAVKETIRLADAYTDLTNKIRFATRSEQEMNAVRSELFRVANQNRAAIEDTADVYGKLKLSTQALGLSQREVIDLTDTLQKATIVSGASAENAANALRQLGQGMAAGALRGDELNSVLENTPYLADVIAKSLGKDIGAIRQMGAEGKITGKIIYDAFKGARDEIEGRFAKTVPTVSQSINVLTNSVTELVGELDGATGATGNLSQGIINLANDIRESIPQIKVIVRELTDMTNIKGPGDFIDSLFGTDSVSRLEFWSLGLVGLKEGLAALTNVPSLGFTRAFDEASARYQKFREELAGAKGGMKLGAGFGRAPGTPPPADPLEERGKASPSSVKAKGPTFAEILHGLERENELLKLNNEERRIEQALDQAKSSLKGKVTDQQVAMLRHQIEENQVQEAINDSLEERLKLEVEAIKAEEETKATYTEILQGLDDELRLSRLSNDEREIAGALIDAQARAQGKLNDEQLRTIEIALRRNQRLIPVESDEMPKDFEGAKQFMGDEFLKNVHTFGQEMAEIFGPGGVIQAGLQGMVGSLTDVIGHSIAFGESWEDTQEAIKNVGRSILAEIISSLIRIPIQMGINEAIASGLRSKATAEAVASNAAIATSAAPAAAGVSLATAGANSAGATAAIVGVTALAAGAIAGAALFEDGGYTGNGPRGGVAGLVHGQEYVLNADATRRYRGHLDAMNAGSWQPPANSNGGSRLHVSIVNQAPGVQFETRQVDDERVEIIARRVVQQLAPDVIARDMQSPQGKTGKAMTKGYTATRKRA